MSLAVKKWIYKVCKWPYLGIYTKFRGEELPASVAIDKDSRIHNLVQVILRVLWMNNVVFLDKEQISEASEPLPVLSLRVFLTYHDIS